MSTEDAIKQNLQFKAWWDETYMWEYYMSNHELNIAKAAWRASRAAVVLPEHKEVETNDPTFMYHVGFNTALNEIRRALGRD